MISILLCFIVFILSGYLFYKWFCGNYDYFEKKGVKYLKPWPFIGSALDNFIGIGVADRVRLMYNAFPQEKITGFFELNIPVWVIRSPDVLKQMMIKDFSHFQDHSPLVDPSVDEYMGNMLFSMGGEEWRDMRATLSTMFTGYKMRLMLPFITKCANQVVDHIQKNFVANQPWKVKDMVSRYTNDVIASCAFGIECDSLGQPNNEIYEVGQEILKAQKSIGIFKFLFIRWFPSIAKLLGMKFINNKISKKFSSIILNTMEVRKREGIVRQDMLQILMKLRDGQVAKLQDDEKAELEVEQKLIKGKVKHSWTDVQLLAQSFVFFLAGFDTSSTAITFILYELAVNQDVQDKLRDEVDRTYKSLDGEPLTYEVLLKMKYMDMVVYEGLRKWPPNVATDRKCVKKYLYDMDGKKFIIEEGNLIVIPTYAFHMDPKYFPNPDKFDPDRFSDENKSNVELYTSMPFGIGPRICIASRLALMEIKILLFHLLLNFKINVCADTDVPLKLKKSTFGFLPQKEIKLLFQIRDK